MASSGKKSKKAKRVTVPLNEFLVDTPTTTLPVPSVRKTANWADEVEDESDNFEPRPKPNIVLPTAPRAARVPSANDSNVPQQGPFMAYISNLTYDADEKELADFFGNLKISNLRLPREDRESGKLRGFGYVEFADRNSLLEALTLSDTSLKGRRVRIEVSSQSDERVRRGGGRGGMMDRDRTDRSENTSGGWRTGPRNIDFNEPSSGGAGERRSGMRAGDDSIDNKSWRDSSDRPSFRDNRDNKERSSGFGRRNYDREDSGFSRQRRDDDRNDNAEPRTRPKLKLAPRKEPIATVNNEQQPVIAPAVPAVSIFGAAKPVDTSAREREIEEKLAREKEELKDADVAKKEQEISKTKLDTEKEENNKPIENSWRTREDNNHDGSRKNSPVLRRRGDSPRRRGDESPRRRNYSPARRRDSPRRHESPSRRRDLSPSRRESPSRRRDSPPRRRDSPPRRRDSPPRRRDSPNRRRESPSYRRRGGDSPTRRRDSPTRSRRDGGPRRNDEKRSFGGRNENSRGDRGGLDRPVQRNYGSNKSGGSGIGVGRYDDKPHKDRNNTETRERNIEDRMPKLKEQEPPNFAASNKYAFLQTEDVSD